ncbi:CatB-related O-acetyltransferase [Gymnodinialimonas sp. 2305UL16-5]|uniref:CatB-related O-acetyltransferase n=1 Tax=Gymnodinialimonas mytili TaxID=3126503 RepID=UPI00309F37A1
MQFDSPSPSLPDPALRHPLVLPGGGVDSATVFLKQVIDHPNIEVGDWSYANNRTRPANYAETLAPYLFPGAPERLIIGKFCQIAEGVQFVTATANHPMAGASTYPFAVFDPARFGSYLPSLPHARDTTIGHDCWLGREAMLMPGAELGNGVIVGARSVVRGRVPDYAVVLGDPAQVVRMRYCDAEIAQLLDLAWWDWPADRIAQAIPAIEAGDFATLASIKDAMDKDAPA